MAPEGAQGAEARPVDPPPSDPVEGAIASSVPPGPEDEELNDDERERFNWRSRYDVTAWKKIKVESIYVASVVLLSLLGLLVIWHGLALHFVTETCIGCNPSTLRRFGFVFFSGVLGGGLFGLKYLYKVVARGYWNEDRIVWRYASPLLSGGLAFAAGALAQAGIFGFANGTGSSSASFVALGFIVGYFADKASGKMQEVAETLFGTPAQHTNRKAVQQSGTRATNGKS